ncbi:MAG: S9 family peptidase [Phycisphaerales bacterium]|nr:S9 family peptidase [Phycisphaerales bacterium]
MTSARVLVTLAALTVAPALAQQIPLIPRETFFGNPDRAAVRISPDGKYISYLADSGGVLNVFVGPADDPSAAQPVTHETKRPIGQYQWAYTSRHILYSQDQGGDENWCVYATDVDTKETKNLTPYKGVQAQIVSVDEDTPTEIIVGINNRNPQLHDLHRVSILTGEDKLIRQTPDGVAGWVLDNAEKPRYAIKFTELGGQEWLRVEPDGSLAPAETIAPEDALTTSIMGFSGDDSTYYLQDSRGRDTAALFQVDDKSGVKVLLAQSPKADAAGVLLNPRTKQIEAVSFDRLRPEWTTIDPAIGKDLATLRRLGDGDVEVTSRTLDDTTWIVALVDDNGPVKYYRYTRGDKPEATFLFDNREALASLQLAPMHALEIKTRDGLSMVSYLTLPVGAVAGGEIKPKSPLPMVLLVHGGPWARDEWGYNGLHQLLANRGYAVLSVNYRGSTGFGKAFTNAGNLEWGAKMQDDLTDAVDWAVQQGVAATDRVAIMGGSYGGYATLAGLTMTPDKYACGVDIVGPSNLVTLLESIPPYWKPQISIFHTRMGDNTTAEGRSFLESRSPLTFADRIVRPLLIGQGANDPRVKQAESDQIVAAMEKKNIPVTYVVFPDEGHGFHVPANNIAFFGISEAFLAQHLGGRYEPLDGAVAKSTAEVKAGAGGVPGLAK